MEKPVKVKKTVRKKPDAKSVVKSAGLSIKVFDLEGKEKKELVLAKEIFSVKVSPKLLAQYVRVYLANQRQGNASTKTRGEVIGSTRKIYRQKGTGKARHGDIKAPIFVGGGVVGGPTPRDYSLKMNKKQKQKALFGALSLKYEKKLIFGLTETALKTEPKTKIMASFLKKMDWTGKRVLFVLPELRNNLVLASRNLYEPELIEAKTLNPYIVMRADVILFLEPSVNIVVNHFLKKNED